MTKADEAYQKLDIAAFKILGIAALFQDESGDGRRLESDESNGLPDFTTNRGGSPGKLGFNHDGKTAELRGGEPWIAGCKRVSLVGMKQKREGCTTDNGPLRESSGQMKQGGGNSARISGNRKLGVDPIQVLKFDVMVLPGSLTKNQHYRAFDLFREKKTAEDVYMAIFGKTPVTDER